MIVTYGWFKTWCGLIKWTGKLFYWVETCKNVIIWKWLQMVLPLKPYMLTWKNKDKGFFCQILKMPIFPLFWPRSSSTVMVLVPDCFIWFSLSSKSVFGKLIWFCVLVFRYGDTHESWLFNTSIFPKYENEPKI